MCNLKIMLVTYKGWAFKCDDHEFHCIYTFNKNFDLLVTTFQQYVDVHNYFGCKLLHVCNCRLKKKFCKVGWWRCKISRWWLWMKKVVEPFLEHFSYHYYYMCIRNICKVTSKYGTWRFVGGCFETI